jgi:hypothetical protein
VTAKQLLKKLTGQVVSNMTRRNPATDQQTSVLRDVAVDDLVPSL